MVSASKLCMIIILSCSPVISIVFDTYVLFRTQSMNSEILYIIYVYILYT
jgi:hypothetical protein